MDPRIAALQARFDSKAKDYAEQMKAFWSSGGDMDLWRAAMETSAQMTAICEEAFGKK